MTWMFGNSIRLRSHTGLEPWRTKMRASTSMGFGKNVEENIKTSTKQSLGMYEL